jgi:acyl-[acyl-carrier-protein]-phospholipid O-acyltransferase / long-chain-fatty-acid--[acyl-carrier-protein] ligase
MAPERAESALGKRPLLRKIREEGARLVFKLYFRTFHSVTIEGADRVPKHVDKLIVIANHASLLDGLLVWTYLKLPFKIVVDRTMTRRLIFRPFLKNDYIVPIDSMSPYSLKEVIRRVDQGTPLLIFPEGRMTLTGSFMKIYEGTGFAALMTGAHILPLHLKNTYKTIFARKHPGRRFFVPITMVIGEVQDPITADQERGRRRKEEATRAIYRMLTHVRMEAYNETSTLGREFIRKCKENRGTTLFRDATDRTVSYRKALIGAFVLGRYFSRYGDRNIGIMLPNLSITALLFMGLQLFRKTVALLNYSSGPAAVTHAMDLADLNVVVTSRAFLDRIHLAADRLFAGREVVFLEDIQARIGLGDKLWALSRSLFPGAFGRFRPGQEQETACVLFTSGSEGTPKGVCLSHENLISNVHQALSRIDIRESDYFLNALPIFHAFGLMFGIIIPFFADVKVFLYVSPLHYRVVPEIAYEEGCTILCGTNTFLGGYAKKADAYDFYSMRYIFCGAEALSDRVFEQYARTFGIRVMSGYGATECSPIISIHNAIEYEYGTVGMVLPGIEYKLVPVAGIADGKGRVGRLFIRGKNVMKGYLKNEAANRKYLVEDAGWYDTGDIVEITEKGFLKIVGRLKRFAKISGEMVSLSAVEDALAAAAGERVENVVIAVPDEQRGERLILVTNSPSIELRDVREMLRGKGFSDLASPREVRVMKEMPRLGTGKIDYVTLKDML